MSNALLIVTSNPKIKKDSRWLVNSSFCPQEYRYNHKQTHTHTHTNAIAETWHIISSLLPSNVFYLQRCHILLNAALTIAGMLSDKMDWVWRHCRDDKDSTYTHRMFSNVEDSVANSVWCLFKPLFAFIVHACTYIYKWLVQVAENGWHVYMKN